MNENKIKVPIMQLPCDECIDSPSHTASNGEFIATFCRHRNVGAILEQKGMMQNIWRIFSGISEEAFAAFVIARTSMT